MTKMFRIFWQVWIGEIGKKDYQNAKKTKKKQIVNDWLSKNFGFQMSIFFRKIFHEFPKFFDKIFHP